ncbi:MAG: TonB-dependent receptor [Chitinophagales bacterium]
MKQIFSLILLLLSYSIGFSQTTQNIKGQILDLDTQEPLFGAAVYCSGYETQGVTTDINGNYTIENIPVGQIQVIASYLGYETYYSGVITHNSGKTTLLPIEMSSNAVDLGEILIIANYDIGQAKNEDLTVSTRSISLKEANRFAGSIGDPGRVVLNMPGVQTSQDNNTDIMVRGNSAMGILWRLEGIDVPNVNHFSRPGSSGGGISALSPNVLGTYDFSTGAFPAEYGNAIAGVFDMKYRKGNPYEHNFSIRAGIIGLNFGAEGPLSKNENKQSSYLFNYRYSTLGILNKMGIHVVGENTDNTFQDLSFNISLPTQKKAQFSIFGLGGLSSEITKAKKDTAQWENYSDKFQTNFLTNLGVVGLSWTQRLNNDSYLKTVVAGTYNDIRDNDDTLDNQLDFHPIRFSRFTQSKIALGVYYNNKLNPKLNLKTGVNFDQIFYAFDEKKYVDSLGITKQLIKGDGNTTQIQPFFQLKYRPTSQTTIIAGLRANYLALNHTYAIEPRLSIQQKINNHNLSLAYGLNSQALTLGSYFTQDEDKAANSLPNFNLEMIKSHHLVLSYDFIFRQYYRLKIEPYFQYIYDAPVGADISSTTFLLNTRSGYAKEKLVNKGTGMNYGVDISLEKFYTNKWFAMINGSIFSSTYTPLDGKKYSTHYDNRFGLSLMGGKLFSLKKSNSIEMSIRLQYSGGFRYTPIDLTASIDANEAITNDELAYTLTNPHYIRPDFRIAYRKNKKKYSWILSLDLANFINRKNVLRQFYNRDTQQLEYNYQYGLLPILAFQVDFSKKKK